MTNKELAVKALRFFSEANIKLECQQTGQEFDPEKFEKSFQIMLATDHGQTMIEKMSRETAE